MSRRAFLKGTAATAAGTLLSGSGLAALQPSATKMKMAGMQSSETIQLEFWNGIGPPEGVLMEELMKRWAETQPNVQLNQWTTDWDNFYAKLKIAVAEGTVPDLAVIHPWRIAAYADTAFKPVDDLLAAETRLTADMFQEVPWKAMQYGGKQYGLPVDNFLLALYYNVGLLKAANVSIPKSNEELIALAKSLTAAPETWGLSPFSTGGNTWEFTAYLAHEGQKSYLSEDGTKAAFNNDAGLKALQRLYDNIYKEQVSPGPSEGLDGYQIFLNGQSAFRLGGTWEKFGYDGVEGLDYSSIVFTPDKPGTFGGSHNFVFSMANGDQRVKAAWDAATWILLNCDAEWGIRAGHIPALKKASQDQAYLDASKHMPGHRDSVPYMVGLPHIAKLDQVEEAVLNGLNSALLNATTPAQALADAESKVNAILAG